MGDERTALLAHLMRRAGFGATRSELQEKAGQDYEAVVEDLLHPERAPQIEYDLLERYYPGLAHVDAIPVATAGWIYRIINSQGPLEEKIALFWHHVFATAWFKSEHPNALSRQIQTFREVGLSDLRTILLSLSRDPAMLHWLDNNENHRDEPNENYGRELLELFSMGVGNYTEQDIKMAARAFTGWTFEQPLPLYPYGNYPSRFRYQPDDHDDGVKTFLGESGRLNGEDIIDIVVRQEATARFISRHLYNFFVADEPQVPAWGEVPPQDPEAIEALMGSYVDSGGDIRSMLRVLFNADWFKLARYKKVKSPAELIAGVIKLVGTFSFPDHGLDSLDEAAKAMGQQLMNPPTVEGWHTGREWINGATLNERVNFAVDQVGDATKPGIREIAGALNNGGVAPSDGGIARSDGGIAPSDGGAALSPEEFVDRSLELAGPIEVDEETRIGLVEHASAQGELRFETETGASRVSEMLQLIVATPEYQLG